MQAKWSFLLNILLLAGVLVAIVRILKARRTTAAVALHASTRTQPSVGGANPTATVEKVDDIIAVRKINRSMEAALDFEKQPVEQRSAEQSNSEKLTSGLASLGKNKLDRTSSTLDEGVVLVIFLRAKENRQLAGYELLQTILSVGLRFGEGHLFHRHQHPNGQGPVLCSLATATESGVFDLQNIGAFSVRGLCLFMQASGSTAIDMERFSIMVETAKQLSEDLDTHLLDDERKPWSASSVRRYTRLLNAEALVDAV